MLQPSNSQSQPEIRRGVALLISAFTGVMFSSIVLPYYSLGALIIPVTEEFGWTRAQFQTALVFSTSLGAITAPAVGWFVDKFGSRRVALPGLVGLSLGFFMVTQVDGSLWMFYACYSAMALLGAGTTPVTWTQAITRSFTSQRGLALGLTLTGTGVCGVLVPQYTTYLVDNFGWRAAYLGLALLPTLIAWPMVYWGFRPRALDTTTPQPPTEDTEENLSGMTLLEAAKTPAFWVLLISILCVYMAVSGIGPNLYPAVTDAGMTTGQAATIQSIFGGAIIFGRLTVGYLVDRFWAPAVAAISMLLPVGGCLLLIEPATFVNAAIASALLGLAAGAELDLMSFLAARYFGLRHYGKIYSVLYMGLAVSSGTSPLLFATIYDSTQTYVLSFSIAAGLFALGSILILFMGRYPKEYAPSH